MKTIYKSIFSCSLALVMLGSCTKFDDSINTDPNSPTKASGTQLIANAELSLPGISSSPYGVHYPQYLSNTSFSDNSRYVTVNFNFYGLYTGPLMNLENVINNTNLDASEGPVPNQIAVAKILKAYYFWHMTDRWGDLPYTEALKGDVNYSPKYDKQQAIYNALFTLLDEANAAFVTGAIKNDIVYGGDVTKWKKLGNTIHALMALRLSKVDATKGAAEFNKAVTNGTMTANTDNLTYPHLADQNNENYWYNSFTRLGRNWFAVSKPVVDYMQPLNDPRLPVYANKPTNTAISTYVGLDYGLPGSTTVTIANYSLLGSNLRLQNSPVALVTYAQSLFAMAEAAKLGWITGGDATALANYNNAVTESIRQWTGSTTNASTYLGQASVAYDPVNALMKIGTQRWVHLFLHGYEGWAEWRRTGFPTFLAPPPANNGALIPRREAYGTQERSINTTNYNAAVSGFPYGGADDLNARVWWDKP
ncbi:SusD/RagB family nutrient-binding outer membrane lipoprotein [Pedobacter frigiditerrae]|uniref:SusD/RagB family nutrient-binding outer membrane lipoprotein n=1 Tax=Pedobacter frigiditerrae TaxID=2530452 RepID=A0A4R0MTA8_9SPHI|nr:SusD/RagB family nutrient-binding outer membrane lipoprotein [Pedobacter frigiditerrae]TCC90301.1 SusD/RagB family nutrient-binding outer membrane lipoprotein [Pedobacter frigiditerrae]